MLSQQWLVLVKKPEDGLYYEARFYVEKAEDAVLQQSKKSKSTIVAVLPVSKAHALGYNSTIRRPDYDVMCERFAAGEWAWPRRHIPVIDRRGLPRGPSAGPRRAPDHAPNWWDMPLNPETGLRVDPEDAMAAVRALSGKK